MAVESSAAHTERETAIASTRVASYLRERIVSGELVPGQRIRQEHFAELLGASRLPVRQALRLLESEGLIVYQHNKGARVTNLDRGELEVLYKIRERIEPLALVESMPNLTQRDLLRLDEIQDQIEANNSVEGFLQLNREFHMLTFAGCTTDHLMSIVERLWNSTQQYRRASIGPLGDQRSWRINAEHRMIIDSIRRGDAVEAEQVLTTHIRRTRVELAHLRARPHGAPVTPGESGDVDNEDWRPDITSIDRPAKSALPR